MERILSSPHSHFNVMAEDSISVEFATPLEESNMIAASARSDSSPNNYSRFWSLAISTVFAVAVVLLCRSLVSFISHDAAELDGFIFVAALYWVSSLVGYFATSHKVRRKASVGSSCPAPRASQLRSAEI